MTSKIANVANLAFHVFQQHSNRATQAVFNRSLQQNQNNPTSNYELNPHNNVGQMQRRDSPSKCEKFNNFDMDSVSVSLKKLLNLVSSLTPKDVGFNESWISESSYFMAPVLYVHIMENQVFSMGIFVIRPGARIPLHDHPGMFGILRVIYGSVRCRNFTIAQNSKDNLTDARLAALSSHKGSKWQLSDIIVAKPHQDTVITPESEPCFLTPSDGNLHELTVIGGPAVFLDILAPPYDHDLGTRECRFYKEIALPNDLDLSSSLDGYAADATHSSANGGGNVDERPGSSVDSDSSYVYLVETHQPKDYWSESAEYVGPSVS